MRDVDLLASAEGLRVILQSLADGPAEFAPSLGLVLLFLIDRPHLRAYLRAGTDLEIALAGLTESFAKQNVSEEKLRSSGRVITLLLKSWSGSSLPRIQPY